MNLDTLARLIAADTELAKALTPLLGRLVESLGAFKKMHEEVVAWIDKRPLVTLTVGGTEQKGDFGPDKEFVGLRSDWPLRKDQTAKLTVDWNRMDNMMADAEEIETFKAGLEWSTLWNTKLFSKNSQAAEDGIEVSFAATWEKFDNVPDAMHDTQSKVSAKLELPLAKGLTLPLSVTWADHVDLLSDEDEVKGHFGLSYDLSKLFNREEDEEGK
ncbi:MAG: hypothetical protein GY708_15120 [Actinomycetia bacterium]|nr:hypothetical protein [Actinomycetes bacterium]